MKVENNHDNDLKTPFFTTYPYHHKYASFLATHGLYCKSMSEMVKNHFGLLKLQKRFFIYNLKFLSVCDFSSALYATLHHNLIKEKKLN